jgi:Protein of unknown function (DUF3987)/Bifunctional DNA primase/polymerase, N-terminal
MLDQKCEDGHEVSVLESAINFAGQGWAVVPIPFREKGPTIFGWQHLRLTAHDANKYFNGRPQNIGVLLGAASGGLVDIDLDSPEAVKLADFFLPKTGLVFGRRSKPKSHRLYICEDASYKKFNNPLMLKSDSEVDRKNACIAEIRGNNGGKGLQTVFPPSVHPSGEHIEWHSEGAAPTIMAADLERAVSKLCAAAIIAKYWRGGIRQEMALAVGGILLRHGFNGAEAKHFIKAICFGVNDEEAESRVHSVDYTAARLATGESCYGIPKLAELTDQKIVDSVCVWLGIEVHRGSVPVQQFVGDPKPLDFTLKPVEKLEDGCLPEVLVRWLRPASRVIGCPYDFLVLSAIVTAGSLIGARVRVKPIENSDWFVVPNLYGGLVGLPSTKKTPALDETQQVIASLQQKARVELKARMEDYEIDQYLYEKAAKEAYGKAKSRSEIKEHLEELTKPSTPVLRRYQTNDVTTPKLIQFLGENPNGILLFRDELIGWLRSLENDYERSARAFILEVWKGAISYELARADGREIPLTSGTLSIIGGIQPSRLQRYVAEAYSLDNSDGLLQRLSLVYPDAISRSAKPTASDYQSKKDGYAVAKYAFDCLAERDFRGNCFSPNGDKYLPIRFSEEAQKLVDVWQDGIEVEAEAMQAADEPFAAYLYKLPTTCFSIALIFHCLENAMQTNFPDEISRETTVKSLDYTSYLVSHARRIYALGENQIFDLGRKLVEKLKCGDLKQGFTAREIKRKKWSGFGAPDDISEVLALLVDYGYLTAIENPSGRRTTKFFYPQSLEAGTESNTHDRDPP